MRVRPLLAAVLLGLAVPAGDAMAQVAWHGYLDLRVATPASERDWSDGGLGKTRFGGDGVAVAPALALGGAYQLTPELLASAELQARPGQHPAPDLLEAWVRWRPVSTTPWRWSVRAGVFFPPVSLENDGPGWTSPWTLSPSAINTWIGEEFRATGGELRLEHRARSGTWTATVAAFGRNDPAGDLLASRGWALGDLTTGAFGQLREPDVYAPVAHAAAPVRFHPFREIDDRIGWYAGLAWEGGGDRRFSLLRYDNRADPEAWQWQGGRKVFAWHTRFWSVGGQARIGAVELLAQGMVGNTAFEPQPALYLDTELASGYLLAGWQRGTWEPALRVDWFQLRQLPETLAAPLSEHGNALTAALNWRPRDGWRITGELLRVASAREQRRREGRAARAVDLQAQLSVRWYF